MRSGLWSHFPFDAVFIALLVGRFEAKLSGTRLARRRRQMSVEQSSVVGLATLTFKGDAISAFTRISESWAAPCHLQIELR